MQKPGSAEPEVRPFPKQAKEPSSQGRPAHHREGSQPLPTRLQGEKRVHLQTPGLWFTEKVTFEEAATGLGGAA